MLIMRRRVGGIVDPERIKPTFHPRQTGFRNLDAIAL